MRSLVLALVALVGSLAACGSSSKPSAPAAATSAPVVTSADVTSAPAQTKASHVKLGFAFTANLLGELEPCG